MAAVSFTACSPDSFEGADPNGIPSLEGVEPVISVDQSINQVTFSLPENMKGTMPVWIFYENKGTDKQKVTYSTVNGLKRIFAKAGEYEGEFKLMNRNGVSDGSKPFKFKINNTIMDFGKFYTLLCGAATASSKEWRIDNKKEGHLGCGPSGTTGVEWWHAGPDEKAAFGVYDNRLTFSTEGGYTFDPGESGTMYVNTGCSMWPELNDGADFCVPVDKTSSTFEFEVEGEDLYLVFPPKTPFPYICNDDLYNNPRYKIESMTPAAIELVSDNGDIAWHYSLTSGAAPTVFKGFKYDSEFNLWKHVDETDDYTTHFWYAPGWAQIADPEYSKEGNSYTFTLPASTTDQWMAQCPLKPSALHLSADKLYDFSCTISSNVDLPGVTVKLTDVNSGDNYVFAERVPVAAFDDHVFYVYGVNAMTADADCELFFDFGGNPENTVVTVSNIVIKDHANDDGTVVPSDEDDDPEEATFDWNPDAATNLWKAVEDGSAFISVTPWFANNDWGQIGDPVWDHADGVWSLTIPEGMGGSQWQGQFPINTSLTASADKKYNFYCVVETDQDAPGVTIKLVETNVDDTEEGKRDQNFFCADRHDITAYKEFVYKIEDVSLAKGTDAHALSLFFDFGGTPVGTNVKISKIYFEESISMDYNDADNMWTAVDEGSALVSVTPWFANNDWGQIGDPKWEHDGNQWNLIIPEGMGGSQWQGQFPINTNLTASAADSYSFSCTIETDQDAPGVTIKLVETNVDDTEEGKRDQNFFFADRHNVKAYEPYEYTVKGVTLAKGTDAHALSLFFDFGGTPAGTIVNISNIVLKKN